MSVCTTAKIRSEIVIDAAGSGVKAIWAEKPISTTIEEADEVIALAESKNLKFTQQNHTFHTEILTLLSKITLLL